jgi:hypothetical protein
MHDSDAIVHGACEEGSGPCKAGSIIVGTQAHEDVAAGRIDTALSAEEASPALESEVLFNLHRQRDARRLSELIQAV